MIYVINYFSLIRTSEFSDRICSKYLVLSLCLRTLILVYNILARICVVRYENHILGKHDGTLWCYNLIAFVWTPYVDITLEILIGTRARFLMKPHCFILLLTYSLFSLLFIWEYVGCGGICGSTRIRFENGFGECRCSHFNSTYLIIWA